MMQDRWYQTDAISSIFSYFERNTGNPVIAMPTGTGKSYVIAKFIKQVFSLWPMQRIIVLTHVQELIQQNADELLGIWDNAPIGIFSAGLQRRDTVLPIIFGGVASVVNAVEAFGHRDLMIVDECDLVSPDGDTMYQTIFRRLKAINPYIKLIGLSACWFRMGHGLITEGGLFTDICYNICEYESFNRLIAEGYISPPIPKRTRVEIDLSKVGINQASQDYIQGDVSKAIKEQGIMQAALQELCEWGHNRLCWLLFCSGVEDAEEAAGILRSYGVSCEALHHKLSKKDRTRIITMYKAGEIRALSNANIFTRGHNHKPIDLIGMLRSTLSVPLWVQMVGRGTRPSPETGKVNCLVLDFGTNAKRLGPINDPRIPRAKGLGDGEAPVKICEHCGTYNAARAAICIGCGAPFTFEIKIVRTAGLEELIRTSVPEMQYFRVDRVMYQRHIGRKSNKPSIKVSYLCGLQMFHEYIAFDSKGLALHHAHDWWRQRHAGDLPLSTDDALKRLSELRTPKRIKVWINSEHKKIMGHEY